MSEKEVDVELITRAAFVTENGLDWKHEFDSNTEAVQSQANNTLQFVKMRAGPGSFRLVTWSSKVLRPDSSFEYVRTRWSMSTIQKEMDIVCELNFPDFFLAMGGSWVAINVNFDIGSAPPCFDDEDAWSIEIDLSRFATTLTEVSMDFMTTERYGSIAKRFIGRLLKKTPLIIHIRVKAFLNLENVDHTQLLAALSFAFVFHNFNLNRLG